MPNSNSQPSTNKWLSQPLDYHFLLQKITVPCVIILQYQNSTIIKMGMPYPFCWKN